MRGISLIFRHEIAKIFKDKSIIFGFIVLPILTLALSVGLSAIRPNTTEESEYVMYFYGINLERIDIGEMDGKQIYVVAADDAPDTFLYSEKFHDCDVLVDLSDVYHAKIYYHENDTVSAYLKGTADSFVRELYTKLFRDTHPDISFRRMENRDISPKENSNRMIAMLLPYMLILPLTANITNFASDTIAGDKSRGTFHQVLLTPVRPLALIMGKIFSVSLISLLSSAIYIGLDVIGSKICEKNGWKDVFGFAGVHVKTMEIVIILIYVVLLCYLFSNLGVLISLFCDNVQKAQTAQMPVTLLCTMAAMMSMFRFGISPALHYLIPVYNICIVFQDILNDRADISKMAVAAVSFLVLSIGVLVITLTSYKSEKVTG